MDGALPVPAGDPASEAEREDAERHVLTLYRMLLKREPGRAEREGWVKVLLDGLSPDDARAAFLLSPEYQGLQRDAELVTRITATRLFDKAWYLQRYPDVAAAGFDPLRHYCGPGRSEERAPNPYFAPLWYRAHAGTPLETDALLDYAERGEAAGLAPGPDFDPAWYRAVYRLSADASPLAHFLQHREAGGFAPSPRLWGVARQAAPGAGDPFTPWLDGSGDPFERAAPDAGLLEPAGLFDANHYQIVNNDVFDSGLDPLAHYCAFGWREGRNPNFYFSNSWYLATNPEVAPLGVNPLLHYLLVGEAAERRPVVYFDPGWYRRTYGVPPGHSALAHYLAHRHTGMFSPTPLFDPVWYRAHCGRILHPRRDLFAHFLVAGMRADLQPSARFDPSAWRARRHGRRSRHFVQTLTPERDNPLIDYLLAHYH